MFKKTAVVLIAATLGMGAARADDFDKLVQSIPAEVTEVATAGNWADGDLRGDFRAIIIDTPANGTIQAHLVLQVMAYGADGLSTKVFKTVQVKQINDKKLPNAFIAVLEDGTENQVTWQVTSFDASSNADIASIVTINAKGEVDVKDAPKEDDAASQQSADRKN
jgi:hypothetical protein